MSCRITPDAPNGQPSILFSELFHRSNDRDLAKKIWAFTQTPLFKQEFSDLEKDENGEPVYSAVAEVLNIDQMLDQSQRDLNLARDMGLLQTSGKPVIYDLHSVAMADAERFNEQASSKIAIVSETEDGKAALSIVDSTPAMVIEADRNRARARLNQTLLRILENMGFDIQFVRDAGYAGIFSPLHAEENARLLKTVIKVSRGEAGLEAIAEEVSHLILAGLRDHTLKQRADAVFTDDVVRKVLGDRYEAYRRDYKDSISVEDRLREEAEGQVLADILRKNNARQDEKWYSNLLGKVGNLFRRLWSAAKTMFSTSNETEIDRAMTEAYAALQPIAEMVEKDALSEAIDKDAIMMHEDMKALSSQVEKIEGIIEEGESTLAKRLDILTKTSSEDTSDLRQSVINIRRSSGRQGYFEACYHIIKAVETDLKKLEQEYESKKGLLQARVAHLSVIEEQASLVYNISTVLAGYTPLLGTLATLPSLVSSGEIQMAEAAAQNIADIANACLDLMKKWSGSVVINAKKNVLRQFITLFHGYLGTAPDYLTDDEKLKWQSVNMIIDHAEQDIPWWDTAIFSAGDSRNPLINIIHNMVVRLQAQRNTRINKKIARLQEVTAKLLQEGHETNFIYQMDENGFPTGYYKAPVDFAKFYKDLKDFADSLKNLNVTEAAAEKAIRKWFEEHTEDVAVQDPNAENGTRMERMPKASLYSVPDFQEGWTDIQKEYYKEIIAMKAEMDGLMPEYSRSSKETVEIKDDGSVEVQLPTCGTLYNVPQVRKSVAQAFDKDGRGAIRSMWERFKNKFKITVDNLDYGERARYQVVMLDFANKPIKNIPISFIHKLDDPRDLSTDGTRAMNNYIAMAINYSEMSRVAQSIRLLKSYAEEDYQVTQRNAGRVIIDYFQQLGKQYGRVYREAGSKTNIGKAISKYIDRLFYGESKIELGEMQIPFSEKTISKDTLVNTILWLTSMSRMGLNILSGITNINQGETQMIVEAATKRFFDAKDLVWSKKEYTKLLVEYLANFNSANRHDRMFLLINQFNSSEDYFRDVMDRDFKNSALKRVLGRGNIYFFNTIGEHYLHTSGMLNVLHHEKVKRLSQPDAEPVSLYDVIKTVHDDNGYHLELDDDIEFVDKNRAFLLSFGFGDDPAIINRDEHRDQLFTNLAVYINKINADMHGGYSEAERGNINQHFLGRFIIQFRQWMFGMYNKLYSREYYDEVLGKNVEGGYHALFRFIGGILHDWKNVVIKEQIEHLSVNEQQNIGLALAQTAMTTLMIVLGWLTAGWKDDDDRAIRLLAYSIRRLELEVGALSIAPNPLNFIQNIFTLVQSPAAGVKTLENISQVFDLATWFQVVKSGRFKGWWKPAKALWTSTPLYNVQRLIDMDDYSYMFNIFKD